MVVSGAEDTGTDRVLVFATVVVVVVVVVAAGATTVVTVPGCKRL